MKHATTATSVRCHSTQYAWCFTISLCTMGLLLMSGLQQFFSAYGSQNNCSHRAQYQQQHKVCMAIISTLACTASPATLISILFVLSLHLVLAARATFREASRDQNNDTSNSQKMPGFSSPQFMRGNTSTQGIQMYECSNEKNDQLISSQHKL